MQRRLPADRLAWYSCSDRDLAIACVVGVRLVQVLDWRVRAILRLCLGRYGRLTGDHAPSLPRFRGRWLCARHRALGDVAGLRSPAPQAPVSRWLGSPSLSGLAACWQVSTR